jgi:hypothetical protein
MTAGEFLLLSNDFSAESLLNGPADVAIFRWSRTKQPLQFHPET